MPTKQTVWTVVSEYFRLFTYISRSVPEARRSLMLKFLQETMAPDVVNGSMCGSKVLVENWEAYLLHFDFIDIQLEHLSKVAADSLVAVTRTSITVSKDTLRLVFPHLNSDGKGGANRGEWSPLATKLLDQKLVMCGSVRFDWNSDYGRVVRLHAQSDMLTPLICLLGSLEDVARVFDKAHITPDFRLDSRITG